jgi:hypothetical protein
VICEYFRGAIAFSFYEQGREKDRFSIQPTKNNQAKAYQIKEFLNLQIESL